jgi:hypothetical protein
VPTGDGPPAFLPARPITQADLASLTEKVRRRVVRWFRMQRLLDADAAAAMLRWENSGFSVDASVRITLINRDVPSYFQSLEHLLTSWTGWPISCRRRGSTGTARRFETSQGFSPRITSSGPPSRHMTKGNVGKRRDAAAGGHAVGGHVAREDAPGDCCDSCDKPPSHDTSRRQRPNSWPG